MTKQEFLAAKIIPLPIEQCKNCRFSEISKSNQIVCGIDWMIEMELPHKCHTYLPKDTREIKNNQMENWIKIARKITLPDGTKVEAKFGNGEIFEGVIQGNWISFERGNFPSPEAYMSGIKFYRVK